MRAEPRGQERPAEPPAPAEQLGRGAPQLRVSGLGQRGDEGRDGPRAGDFGQIQRGVEHPGRALSVTLVLEGQES